MASSQVSAKPDLGSLRIHDGQRSKTGTGKRVIFAAIPVLIFAGIVAAAYAFRSQKPVVEVATAAKPEAAGRQALMNASGDNKPRGRASVACQVTGIVQRLVTSDCTRVVLLVHD